MKTLLVTVFISLLGLSIWLSLDSNHYLRRALVHQTVDIDDYKIFDNRIIKTGKHQPWRVSLNYNEARISEKYIGQIESYKPIAFLLVKDTAIVFEQYWDNYGENSISNSFSMAKSIVGLLIGCAIDDGYIKSVDQKVGEFIPEYSKGLKDQLTIKDLLVMSSGLNWGESYGTLFSLTTKAYYGNNLDELVLGLEVEETPGEKYKYLSINTQLLAMILNRATGKAISEYVSEKIWKKIGAKNDAFWCLDKENGMEKAYCCFNSNARDFARIGQLVLNKGKWNDKQIISEKFLHESFLPANYLKDENGESVDFYGYQWWLLNYKNRKIIYARGILGQNIIVIPDDNCVIVRLGHERSNTKINHHPTDVYLYIDAALEML